MRDEWNDAYDPTPHTCWYVGCGRVAYKVRGAHELEPAYCDHHALLRDRDPNVVIPGALEEALEDLQRHSSTLVKWPLASVHALLGFLLPGTLTYIGAFPSNGKTLFISEMIAGWIKAGVKAWVMPTETRPKGLLTRLACHEAGINADDAMSFRLREAADQGDEQARFLLDKLHCTYIAMQKRHRDRIDAEVCIEPTPMLTRDIFQRSCRAAHQAGCQLVITDHIDNVSGDAHASGYQASEDVQKDALEFAQDHDMPLVAMTQFNTSRVSNDLLHLYRRPLIDWLWMKGVKDQVATTIAGLFRPMNPQCDADVLKAAREGSTETWKVALPNTMGLADLKSRYNGSKRDRTLHLGVQHGRLYDLPDYDQPENRDIR